MTHRKLVEAVENGAETSDEIAEATGLARGHVQRELKAAVDAGHLTRFRDGRSWAYEVPHGETAAHTSAPAPTPDATVSGGGLMPVNRDYDWDSYRLEADEVAEYIPTNGEYEQFNALIDARASLTPGVRVIVGGPTGTGKTSLAEWTAFERDMPLFTVQGRYTMRESDLLGTPSLNPDGSAVWVDGVVTKMLLASRDGPVMLLVDEANRVKAQALSALFSALDHRATIQLDGPRGGERIKGNPQNIVVLATVNEGSEYMVERMDMAMKRRFGFRFNIDYLGIKHPEKEADLLVARTGAGPRLAKKLVEAANAVRRAADSDDASSAIRHGIPTSAVIAWADAAVAFGNAGLPNPVMTAARGQIIDALYGDDTGKSGERQKTEVAQTLRPFVDGAPADEEGLAVYDSDENVECGECGFETPRAKAEEDGLMASMACPACGSGQLALVSN